MLATVEAAPGSSWSRDVEEGVGVGLPTAEAMMTGAREGRLGTDASPENLRNRSDGAKWGPHQNTAEGDDRTTASASWYGAFMAAVS